ncbi:hypothetical protein P20480_1846 [Pseudoalteromonas sp. BSi20480]|jgi:hypothetical protein|nr:hypothetical protein P20480_1846 [Pseudoalteromonas sp. BSi20480]|tara:strand:- start:58 stop:204 length:147 start_codon:yes stop_codon:yes gene_type:complete
MRRAELLDHFSKSEASLNLFVNNWVFKGFNAAREVNTKKMSSQSDGIK